MDLFGLIELIKDTRTIGNYFINERGVTRKKPKGGEWQRMAERAERLDREESSMGSVCNSNCSVTVTSDGPCTITVNVY
jgi:hypothetical protein